MPSFNKTLFCSILLLTGFTLLSRNGFSQQTALWHAQTMLLNLMQYKPVDDQLTAIAEISQTQLQTELSTDSLKKTFWIYLYNSAVQLNLTDSASRANEKEFFGKKVIKVAGHHLSLYDIENGMLRKSRRTKFRMYGSKWFVSDFEKKFRVSQRDWRVFFALNTGVVNDPVISFYSSELLDYEIQREVLRYFKKNTLDSVLTISPVFKRYLHDAGGIEVIHQWALGNKVHFKTIRYKIVPGPLHPRKFLSGENL